MADPVLKWAGGKRQLLDELKARFPTTDYTHFHEPFFGGGALFFDLEPEDGTINDTNPRLVNFYKQVRDNPTDLIELLDTEFRDPDADPNPDLEYHDTNHKGKAIDEFYYQARALFNKRPYGEDFDALREAALLLYLNRTCYNGLYRENNSGGFNVPIGSYTNPDWVQADRITTASRILEDTTIHNDDFEYILDAATAGDLVYFDPPYKPMSATAYFTDYSQDGFDQTDQQRLLDVASELDDRGVHVILSNSGVMYDLYDDAGFHVEVEGATRAINSDGTNRDEVDEIIATTIAPTDQRGPTQQGLTDYTN
ncbi:DNA adenine methylase [Halorubellus sp. PRR65]|uniref:DNA adenine methylase n=1 Tax=Halorubellus sp. PRR65 TaxID=3098148 RepID=UPI002B2588C8|nr:DNA adenine methylase [Halorubellus sp. PRR65]